MCFIRNPHNFIRGACIAAFLTLLPVATNAAELPSGFTETLVATGMSSVTRMEVLPDGRIFVCEQGGALRVIKNGMLLPTPFLTVPADSFGEHGLLGIALDPEFNTNHFVYIYYTATTPVLHNRISRFTANGDTALPGTETVIFELDDLTGELGWHQGGDIRFGPDGKLYVAVGDDRNGANSQSTSNLFGKILRINSDGSIPTDNPFHSSLTGKNRAIWALGLRNPYSFAFHPVDGRMMINDVGEEMWEEVNQGGAGSNYGWPDTEGPTNDPRFRSPIFAYGHGFDDDTVGCAITAGVFYNPTTRQFPGEYEGAYFYADFCQGWIRKLDTGGSSQLFALFTYFPVDLKVSADGALYYLERGLDATIDGAVHKIEFPGGFAPHISSHPSNVVVPVGQSASFSVTASGAAPLSYQWQRDGFNIPGASSSTLNIGAVTAQDDGATFACVVSNSSGSVTSNSAILRVTSDTPPISQIVAPANGIRYRGGDTISYAGTGTDSEDGQLSASAFTWRVDFHHDTHTHPFIPATSGATSGSFTIPTNGETATNVWYRIHLTVTDSAGLTHSSFRDVMPIVETITVNTQPSGLQIRIDDQPRTAPITFSTVAGVNRSVTAVTPQPLAGTNYEFVSWSDGGAASHTLNGGGTFIATYRTVVGPGTPDIVLYAAEATQAQNFVVVNDGTAAGGRRIFNADAGAAKLANAAANPGSYFEMTFNAVAGTAYRLWVRGRAQDDNPFNDSVFVQFSASVNEAGAAVNRIGSSSAEVINLEDCFACGLSGWGWQDNGWGSGVLGPLIYFGSSGQHTIRIQVREDGLSLDQIVLSPANYLHVAPGAVHNDSTILPKTSGGGANPAPTVGSISPGAGPTSGGTAISITGSGFASGATVLLGGTPATNVTVVNSSSISAVTSARAAGVVDVVVTNVDGQSGMLGNGYQYSPTPTQPTDIVLYAAEATQAQNYVVVNDGTAAGGRRIFNPDAGAAKLANAAANPGSYFELTFNAVAGTAYRLWVRGRAQDDNPFNDSVFVQFSGSVNEAGTAVNRIGTTSSEVINLEDCFACGLSGWGWQDNGWGSGVLGPLIYFGSSGQHTIRIQVREDGLSLDQIVLSPANYLHVAPGAVHNDSTILPNTSGGGANPAPSVGSISPASGPTSGGTAISITGSGFASGATVLLGGTPATNVTVVNSSSISAVTSARAAGVVDVVVTNADGQSGMLGNGYQYTAPPTGPTDIVLYAAEATQAQNYVVVNDGTAAGGRRIFNPDAGAAKLANAAANPGSYFELTFNAVAGTAYRLWVRGRAQDDNPFNDSVFVQFSDSVNEAGAAVNRIGSSSAEVINLEDCFACGLSGWGWQDNGWGSGVLGPLIYFGSSGQHTIRIQVREDGLSLDQIVLSPANYLHVAPGAVHNDSTILPKAGAP